jgi:hypothetical protein
MRAQLQFILQQKADRNIYETSRRTTERKENDQDAEIEENPLARRGRQIGRSDRNRGCGTIDRHKA